MKHLPRPIFLLWVLPLLFARCGDVCEQTARYKVMEPVYRSAAEVVASIKAGPAQAMRTPGKIWLYGRYLLVNELQKGIHVVDNRDPAQPRNVAFIAIPGNVDLAVRNNVLYADNYTNLLTIDLSRPEQARAVQVLANVFPNHQFWSPDDPSKGLVFDWQEVEKEVVVACGEPTPMGAFYLHDRAVNSMQTRNFVSSSAAPSPASRGGSMARFTLLDQYLYTVDNHSLRLFNVSEPTQPNLEKKVEVGFGIETIFPYADKLFLGSTTGMFIYSVADPANPTRLSVYSHAWACDPVVVQGNYAYVTLRSGQATCTRADNQLDVVDISNPRQPKLVRTYPMINPHGLAIDGLDLFICEGKDGLKQFNVPAADQVNLVHHLKGFDAYDVIPNRPNLILVGKNGLYQFDYSTPNLRQISLIPVESQQ